MTSFSIATGPGSSLTLSYSGGSGSQFVLLQTNKVTAPLEPWTRVQTNTGSPGSFTITPAPIRKSSTGSRANSAQQQQAGYARCA